MAFPNSSLSNLDGETFVSETVGSLMELAGRGIPKDSTDLRQRIHEYFMFCEERQMRPSIENLCLALGTSRQNFWNWCNGSNIQTRDSEWQELCVQARQVVICFLETAHLAGRINPASAIFLLKNWAGYRDSVELETVKSQTGRALTANDLPTLTEGGE